MFSYVALLNFQIISTIHLTVHQVVKLYISYFLFLIFGVHEDS